MSKNEARFVLETNGATSEGFMKYESRNFCLSMPNNTGFYSKIKKSVSDAKGSGDTFLLSTYRGTAKE